VHIG
jgi:HD-GYP domain-containing protein (c-di-GMP phosphodiesterase class II)